MWIFYSLIERYDGFGRVAIRYVPESFHASATQHMVSGGAPRTYQEECDAIMQRITTTQLNRKYQFCIFSGHQPDGTPMWFAGHHERETGPHVESEASEGITHPGIPSNQENLRTMYFRELIRERNRETSEELGGRCYITNKEYTEATSEASTAPQADTPLAEPVAIVHSNGATIRSNSAQLETALPDATVAAESAGVVEQARKAEAVDAALTADDHAALQLAIDAAGGIEALAEEWMLKERALPMTTERLHGFLRDDLVGFDGEKVCWHCASWPLFTTKLGPQEGIGPAKALVKMLRCSGCKQAYYCSKKCQKDHWQLHGKECRQRAKRRQAV
jgi:hypothetical protein